MFDKFKKKAQGFAVKQAMKKQGVPEEQQEMFLSLMEADPELFEKMGKEIEQLKKEGKGEMAAAMQVRRKYQDRLQKLAMKHLR